MASDLHLNLEASLVAPSPGNHGPQKNNEKYFIIVFCKNIVSKKFGKVSNKLAEIFEFEKNRFFDTI